tara:strand:+ start:67609 stop:69417 length:1809 start_codon:yes stop_codon:yes gene_type:complete
MRRFPLKRALLITIIVSFCSVVLAYQEFDVSLGSFNINRGDDTLLGLQLGLDLEGGSHLVYEALPTEGEEVSEDQMDGVIRTIERRVNSFGVAEPIIQRMGGDRVLIQLPGVGVTKAILQFPVDVTEDEIRNVLASVDRPESEINEQEDGSFIVELPSLISERRDAEGNVTRVGERQSIEDALRRQFTDTKIRVAFSEEVEAELIQQVMEGWLDTTINTLNNLQYDIIVKQLMPEQRDYLEEELAKQFDSFVSFYTEDMTVTITGGVEEAKRLIGQTAQLELKERTCLNDISDITQSCHDPEYHVDNPLNLTGDDLLRAYASMHPSMGVPVVNLEFNDEGAKIFGEHTQRIAGTNNRTAFYLDDVLLIAPVAMQAITGGRAYIQGPDFTMTRVRTIAIQLESGRLQVPLNLIQELDVDATLGEDSLAKSVVAGLIGLGLVLLFMAIYYRLPGVLACLALIIYSIIVLAILKLWPITLTLGGLAAFILSIGMAVDANILIFERMKEELRAGRTLIASIETGFNRAWPAIRDSNVSTFITCAILFWFGTRLGTGVVTGFAVTLFIGVAASMFSALTVTRTLLRIAGMSPLSRFSVLYAPVKSDS